MATNQLNINITNFHLEYMDVTSQHWDPKSEKFAGADHLLTAMHNGWEVGQCVQRTHWYGEQRAVTVYEFHLMRNGKHIVMPVLSNPYVARFIQDTNLEVVQAAERLDS